MRRKKKEERGVKLGSRRNIKFKMAMMSLHYMVKAIKLLMYKKYIKHLNIICRVMLNRHIRYLLSEMKSNGIQLRKFRFRIPFVFNGVRAKKLRRKR